MSSSRPPREDVHPSRRPNFDNRPSKRGRPNPFDSSSVSSKTLSTYALKEKIRDLSRLLEHSKTLPADVRIEKERALAGYRADMEKSKSAKKRNDIVSKYHMVRFFERQKATRALKKLRTKLSSKSPNTSEHVAVEAEVHEAEVDLNYTMYYPLAAKYQSLYPRTAEQGPLDEKSGQEMGGRGERKVVAERPPLWFLVERAMAEGTLEALRDGEGQTLSLGSSRPPSQTTAKQQSSRPEGVPVQNNGVKLTGGPCSDDEDEEMSDGDFFEE